MALLAECSSPCLAAPPVPVPSARSMSRVANRQAAEANAGVFDGRVRHFELTWEGVKEDLQGDEVRLELLKWVGTGTRLPRKQMGCARCSARLPQLRCVCF